MEKLVTHWRILLLLIFFWLGIWQLEQWDRDRDLVGVTETNETLVRSFAEHASISIAAADRLANYVKNEVEREQGVPLSVHYLFQQLRTNPTFMQGNVTDSEGNVIASVLPLLSPLNIKEVDYFKVHIVGDSGAYILNRPIHGSISGRIAFHLSRRLNKPDGSFAGVVSIALDPLYYSRFYEQTVVVGALQTVTLVGTDGIIRARYDESDNNVGKDVSQRPVVQAMYAQTQGTWIGDGLLLNNRLLSYKKVNELPLYITVAADVDAVMKTHRSHQWVLLLTGFTLTFLFFGLYVSLQRSLRYERALKEKVQAELQQRDLWAHQLQEISLRDGLTGLYNRSYWEEYVEKSASLTEQRVGIVVVDIGGLALVNDTMGELSGDKLLQQTADLLLQCSSPDDLVARIGDDEFVLLRPLADENEMAGISVDLRRGLKDKLHATHGAIINLSIGYAAKDSSELTLAELFRMADDRRRRERLHQKKGKHGGIIDVMVAMLAARDYVTEGHAGRMESLVEAVALKIGLDHFRVGDLKLFARFHDLGKVGIPDAILKKPGPLTPKEREEMERHSEIGYRIACASPELACIADWILQHHERWDGKGYPMQYAGEKIPIECRILSVVDAYDAMVSDRPYRRAMQQQEALDELQDKAGSQFDTDVVKTFLQIVIDGDVEREFGSCEGQ